MTVNQCGYATLSWDTTGASCGTTLSYDVAEADSVINYGSCLTWSDNSEAWCPETGYEFNSA